MIRMRAETRGKKRENEGAGMRGMTHGLTDLWMAQGGILLEEATSPKFRPGRAVWSEMWPLLTGFGCEIDGFIFWSRETMKSILKIYVLDLASLGH